MSEGIRVRRRGTHGIQGSQTYYSSLWCWSERCRAEGLLRESTDLKDEAQRLESAFGDRLQAFLSDHPLADLPSAAFFEELSVGTTNALLGLAAVEGFVVAAGRVGSVTDNRARIVGKNPANEAAIVDLPVRVFLSYGLSEGADVWVLSRALGSSALVEVVPAFRTYVRLAKAWRNHWAHSTSWLQADLGALPLPSGPSGSSQDRAYEESSGARPSDEYIEGLFADTRAGKLTIHELRPAG